MTRKPDTSPASGARTRRSPRRPAWRWRWPWAAAAALGWALAGPAPTQSCRSDWKLFDGTSSSNPALCFFDASGVTRAHGHDVGVWAKCIGEREIKAIDPNSPTGREITARNGRALIAGYVPPAASLDGLDSDGRMSVISYEFAADLADIKPRSAIYYELNCAQGTVRALRVTAEAATAAGFRGAPTALDPATPRGSGTSLLQLLCGLDVAGQPPHALTWRPRADVQAPRTAPVVHMAVAHQRRVRVAELTQRPEKTAMQAARGQPSRIGALD